METHPVAEPALRLIDIEKSYGSTRAVAGVSLDVAEGEFVTLLGPSGCGKTTTLSLIAGFFPLTAGEIRLKGRSVENLPPFRRDIGVVFQDYALFPHMTVTQNVGFGLKMRKVPTAEIATRVEAALDLVKLSGLGERKPLQLSGGQCQRVALARALVINPDVLLLDEPLSNLDLKLREEMRVEIASLQRRLGITTIFVTHDQGEALIMSDRVAVMNAGEIEQVGRPSDIYERPASRFVADFIGRMNFFPGKVDATGGKPAVVTPQGLRVPLPDGATMPAGTAVNLAIRPERAAIAMERSNQAGSLSVPGKVKQILYLGARREVHLDFASGIGGLVEITNEGELPSLEVGAEVYMTVPLEACRILPDDRR